MGTDDTKFGAERRRSPRVLINLEVDYGSEDTFLFAYITDISAMGIFVKTTHPEPPGTRLNLKFSPPGLGAPVELEGEVIWINEYHPGRQGNVNPGMGVKFVDLDADKRRIITELVRTFAYLSSDDDESSPQSESEALDGNRN